MISQEQPSLQPFQPIDGVAVELGQIPLVAVPAATVAISTNLRPYWGVHFPDLWQNNHPFWNRHFPDGALEQNPGNFVGYGPPGAAAFGVDLESGFRVTLDWGSDIIKSYSGKEQRVAPKDAPKQRFEGATLLLGADRAKVRAELGHLMALGVPFLLGLQYEGLALVADGSGSTVYVNPAMIGWSDWLFSGQRVILKNEDDSNQVSVSAVIQSVNAGSGAVVLDSTPGLAGKTACEIMPAFAIYFEPQQNFKRYPVNAELWDLSARNAVFDFVPPRASLDLGSIHVGWAGASIVSRVPGEAGNLVTVELDPFNTNPVGGVIVEAPPTNTTLQMKGGTDTLTAMATLINSLSSIVTMSGTYTGATVIGTGDGFVANLTGGSSAGRAGTGATLTTYSGRNVWDWPIVVSGTADDSIQSMITIFDFGGVPISVGTASVPDYGRHVMIRSAKRQDWQWLKKFLWSVKGSQKAFWLPTYRDDLYWQSGSGITIIVTGDVTSWYPSQHDRLMVVESGGVVYTQITSAVTHSDGTTTITLADAVSNIQMISWLELCRFESPSFEIVWEGIEFEMSSTARVVQQ